MTVFGSALPTKTPRRAIKQIALSLCGLVVAILTFWSNQAFADTCWTIGSPDSYEFVREPTDDSDHANTDNQSQHPLATCPSELSIDHGRTPRQLGPATILPTFGWLLGQPRYSFDARVNKPQTTLPFTYSASKNRSLLMVFLN